MRGRLKVAEEGQANSARDSHGDPRQSRPAGRPWSAGELLRPEEPALDGLARSRPNAIGVSPERSCELAAATQRNGQTTTLALPTLRAIQSPRRSKRGTTRRRLRRDLQRAAKAQTLRSRLKSGRAESTNASYHRTDSAHAIASETALGFTALHALYGSPRSGEPSEHRYGLV